MNGINIARVIVDKRREKGVTQDELASFVGVSKSSVSKWENGQSYPDIVFLPQLAAYFNISLDELMGYAPQMTGGDIGDLYRDLAEEFAAKPFDEVMDRCREVAKKYFSCFLLLFRLGVLYVNYSHKAAGDVAGDSAGDAQRAAVIAEAKGLFERVKEQSDDTDLKRYALHLEAVCELMLGRPNEVIELLAGVNVPPSNDVLLSQAYLMTGKAVEAKMELQRSICGNILGIFESLPAYLSVYADDAERFGEICRRAMELIQTFELKALAPTAILPFYLAAAQGYLAMGTVGAMGEREKALCVLEEYTDIATGDIYPLKMVRADGFFDLLDGVDGVMDRATFGVAELPRDERTIRESMADAVAGNALFDVLKDEPRFRSLVEKLRGNV
ncbi:MAG: helix-turn-helix domain-containing protein [Clostridiales bacterium]|nr:helix-turn-helix domain-containing protein [Clostridiales bacterium]